MSGKARSPSPERRQPPEPRPAATVVLLRDREAGGIEVFLVQRQGSMGFMGGVHVFPGGKVSAADCSERMRKRVADAHELEADGCWGEGVDAAAAFARAVAAVRETFEEAGVLLASSTADLHGVDLASVRARLHAGDEFAMLLEHHGLQLRLRMLQPLSRWITPESEPVRFDTSFYVAPAPERQIASHDERESASSLWSTPADALQSAQDGQIRLAPPTTRTLEALCASSSVAAALAHAASRPPPVVLPILHVAGEEAVVLYPGDPEHPVKTRALDGPTRTTWRRK